MDDYFGSSVSRWDKAIVYVTLPFIFLAHIPSFAFPAVNLKSSCNHQNSRMQSNRDLIHKVMQIGDADRMTTEEFAASSKLPIDQVRNTYAAVGKLECPGRVGTAQLTIRGNVITTTAHTIEGDCENIRPVGPEKCVFVVEGHKKKYRIKRSAFNSGYRCPERSADKDWAVLELEENIIGVMPLEVDLGAVNSVRQDRSVVALGYSSDFFRKDKTGRWMTPNPRHIGKCSINDIFVLPSLGAVGGSDCDSANGASGGPLLSSDSLNPKLRGIILGSNELDEQVARAKASKNPNRTIYDPNAQMGDPDRGYATTLLVSGEFAEALRKVQAGNY
jgi:hypothetical protein